jgi:rhodanese-related sulfurtransferase
MNNKTAEIVSATSELLNNPEVLLLDVRTPAEFQTANIPGSVLHCLSDLDPKAVESMAANKKSILVICQSGNRARQAAEKLCNVVGCRVAVLDGGIKNWQQLNLPLNTGKQTISLERQVRIAAGGLVLSGCILAWLINPLWVGLSAFVGAGLIFAGITDTCGMAMLLGRMPWNTKGSQSSGQKSCCR